MLCRGLLLPAGAKVITLAARAGLTGKNARRGRQEDRRTGGPACLPVTFGPVPGEQ